MIHFLKFFGTFSVLLFVLGCAGSERKSLQNQGLPAYRPPPSSKMIATIDSLCDKLGADWQRETIGSLAYCKQKKKGVLAVHILEFPAGILPDRIGLAEREVALQDFIEDYFLAKSGLVEGAIREACSIDAHTACFQEFIGFPEGSPFKLTAVLDSRCALFAWNPSNAPGPTEPELSKIMGTCK
jgi:hypothetical protein